MLSQIKYHPERFFRTRSYVRDLLPEYLRLVGHDIATIGAFNSLLGQFLNIYNRALDPIPLELRPQESRVMKDESTQFMHYGSFVANGRNIFDFGPEVSALFRKTDVEEVLLDSLRLPYRVFYMWFGVQEDLNLWNQGFYVDGCHVELVPGHSISLLLSTIRKDVDYGRPLPFPLYPDRYYALGLPLTGGEQTVGAAIEKELADRQLFEAKNFPSTSGTYNVGGKEIHFIDRHQKTAEATARDYREGFGVFKEALRLVVNGLCYLSAYRADILTKYPDDAPQEDLHRLSEAKTRKARREAESGLREQGFTKIHYCAQQIRNSIAGQPAGREVSPHWRRGHWRNQACGPGLSGHRLVWIMPTVVRRDRGEPAHGHIYLAEEPQPQS